MGVYRIYADKDLYITDMQFANSLSERSVNSNHGKSPALNVFARKDEIVSGSVELARSLVRFSITDLSSAVFLNSRVPITGVNYYLKMFDQPHDETVPSSFNINVFPISVTWDEGNGIDNDNNADIGVANWLSASSTYVWTTTGSDYLHESNIISGVLIVNDTNTIKMGRERASDGRLFATTDSSGNLTGGGTNVWTTWESANRGLTWNRIDTVLRPSGDGTGFGARAGAGVALASNGDLYAAGIIGLTGSSDSAGWIRKANISSSSEWYISDEFHPITGSFFQFSSLAVDPTNPARVLAAGLDSQGSTNYIRRTEDYGQTWTTVRIGSASSLSDMVFTPTGSIFVAINVSASNGFGFGVLRSTDSGNNWSIVDNFFPPAETGSAICTAMHAKNNLEIYAAGRNSSASMGKIILRKTSDGGNTWSTVLSSSYMSGAFVMFNGVTTIKNTLVLGHSISSSLDGLGSKVYMYDENQGTSTTIRTFQTATFNSFSNVVRSFDGDLFFSNHRALKTSTTPLTASLNFFGFYGSGTQHFDQGNEDLEINVTRTVSEWLSASAGQGGTANHGFVVKLGTAEETGSTNFYRKSFHSRESLYIDKLPYLEARWNDTLKDNRGNFAFNVSGTLILRNFVNGILTTLPSPVVVQVKDSLVSGGIRFTSSFSAAEISTGIFTASVAIPYAAYSGTFYDIWTASGSANMTGTFVPRLLTGSANDINQQYVVAVKNLKRVYKENEKIRFGVNVRKKDFVTHHGLMATASLAPQTEYVENMYYSIINDETGEIIVPFGTGSVPYTQLSYDSSGNYFDLWMRTFVPGLKYRMLFLLNINNDSQIVDDDFVFKVK